VGFHEVTDEASSLYHADLLQNPDLVTGNAHLLVLAVLVVLVLAVLVLAVLVLAVLVLAVLVLENCWACCRLDPVELIHFN
jgi:uncharacterized membrane protein